MSGVRHVRSIEQQNKVTEQNPPANTWSVLQKGVRPKAGTVVIGAVKSNAIVAAFLKNSGIKGMTVPAGVCTTWVGISGKYMAARQAH